MSAPRVLVTGGAGFIGSHTCKLLAQQGYTPVTYDNLVTGHRDAVRWGPFVEGDISDERRVTETIRQYQPEAAIHFAASAYVGESMDNPAKYYRNNVAGTVSLLGSCLRCDLDKIVFSSSCATYGDPQRVPVAENSTQEPVSPYGRSKLMCELLLRDYARAYDLGYVALRYFNAAGADPEGELGERHDPETHLIPLAVLAALGARPHLTVFGDDYPTRDGTCIRDYIHVMDLARAHVLAVDYLLHGGDSTELNVGSGHGISVREIVDCIGEIIRRPVPVVVGARRPGDPPELYADAANAFTLLGFKTELSDIETIVSTAARFIEAEIRHVDAA